MLIVAVKEMMIEEESGFAEDKNVYLYPFDLSVAMLTSRSLDLDLVRTADESTNAEMSWMLIPNVNCVNELTN